MSDALLFFVCLAAALCIRQFIGCAAVVKGRSMLSTLHPRDVMLAVRPPLLYRHIRTGKIYPDLYCALLPAMLLGRVLGGLCKMLVYLATARDGFTMTVWLTTYFVQTLPGTVLQLLVIPTIVFALTRAGLIPARYPRQKRTGEPTP